MSTVLKVASLCRVDGCFGVVDGLIVMVVLTVFGGDPGGAMVENRDLG